MTLSVLERDVWKKHTVKMADGVIEIREHRMAEILAAVLIAISIPFCLAFIFYSQYGYFGYIQLLICLFALWIGIYACMTAIKMPRAVRFFPKETVIEQSCVFSFLRWRRRWVDLSTDDVQVLEVEYQSTIFLADSISDPEPFTWRKHCADLLEMLFNINALRQLLRPNVKTVQTFGLFAKPNHEGLLVVLQQRNELDQIIRGWLSSHEMAQS